MDFLDDWRDRHPHQRGGPGRVLGMILLLVLVVILMLNSDLIARGFEIFIGPGSGESR